MMGKGSITGRGVLLRSPRPGALLAGTLGASLGAFGGCAVLRELAVTRSSVFFHWFVVRF